MENYGAPQRRKYRLNKKKLVSTLLTLALVAGFLAVAGFSLVKAGVIPAGAGTSVVPQATGTPLPSQSSGQTESSSPNTGGTLEGKLIVVDAGHGGFDPGAVGVSGAYESTINLAVAQCLKAALEDCGARVIMTREEDVGLGDTQNESLAERRRIIEESGSDIVISIHMNSFKDDPGVSGPVALFMPGSEKGKALAEAMQRALNETLGTDGTARSQSLYVLKSGSQPCVLVECGYLSNEEEESKLQQAEYQQRVAAAICEGAEAFFSGE
jgi:N-acetylmuramoyl-L-alanine amidase